MRKFVLIATAVGAVVLSGAAVSSVASDSRARSCDGCFASVDSFGIISVSRGVKKAKKIRTGVYSVEFKSSLFDCAVTATGYGEDAYASFSIDSFNGKIGYFYTSRRNGSGILSVADATFTAAATCL